ncbi:rolling circle replication-associated protein [Diaphorobacter nitroreducens]|uniref:rolling circle replication-associated protein n=1 Tax=Diaphorobacter nitroreducens TaxID=164759 RepID=UPI00406BACF7
MRENVWFVTLTYRGVDDWQPRHVSKCLKAARRWCQLRRVPFRYLWVACGIRAPLNTQSTST